MAKKTVVQPGFKSAYDNELYEAEDQRLIGYGNPPTCPAWQVENPGRGRMPLGRVTLDIEITTDEDGRQTDRVIKGEHA